MKHTSMMILLLSLVLWGCSESTKKKKSSSSSVDPLKCVNQPWLTECYGNTTGSTSGGTTGTTGGGTTGGSNGSYIPKDNNWQALYGESKVTPPPFECSEPTGQGYGLRKGTITLGGGNTYYFPGGDTKFASRSGSPLNDPTSMSAFSSNISSHLATISQAKAFYDTDAKLRVRFKIRPQPVPTAGQTWCYNRQTAQNQDTWGYTELYFSVSAVGLNADGSLKTSDGYPILEDTQQVAAGVFTCSSALDFSSASKRHPNGIVLAISEVQSDQACWYNNTCTGYKTLRRASCWQVDIEASVDGTKDI